MELRALTDHDAADFWALRLRGFREEPEYFGSSYEEQVERAPEEVTRDLQVAEGSFVLGAFSPALVGIAGLRRDSYRKRRHRAGLFGMYVVPEARGQGVGRALLEELLARAGAAGIEQVMLNVMAHNAGAIALYRAAGFVSYGHAPRAMLLGERAFDEELMRRVLR